MKIQILKKCKPSGYNWQIKFAWLPKRVNEKEIVWFTKYARRYRKSNEKWDKSKCWYYEDSLDLYLYCDVEELLKGRFADLDWASDFDIIPYVEEKLSSAYSNKKITVRGLKDYVNKKER